MTDIKNEDLELILKRYVTSIAIEIKFIFWHSFREKVAKLKEQGCDETDILDLMNSFELEANAIYTAFNEEFGVDEATVTKNSKFSQKTPKSIAASNKSKKSKGFNKVIKMADLTLFITKIEDILDNELKTLRNYIVEVTNESDQFFTLP